MTTLRDTLVAPLRGFAVSLVAVVCSALLFSVALTSVALIPVGIGLWTTPRVVRLLDRYAAWRGDLAARWGNVAIAPPPPANRLLPARHLGWLLFDMTAVCALAALPLGLIAQGLFGFVLAAGVWEPIYDAGGTQWYAFIPVDSQDTANLAAALGVVSLAAGLALGRPVLRAGLRTAGRTPVAA
ncbi:hypothetical protein [Streptomyces avicenniae]|uniref:hypothetical protein n=1 Tax=Streptomyces avicenniae TaxID=500153 RepID=UPI00069C3AE5|nr:hypothetical protein [Streptomyces avicenniae]